MSPADNAQQQQRSADDHLLYSRIPPIHPAAPEYLNTPEVYNQDYRSVNHIRQKALPAASDLEVRFFLLMLLFLHIFGHQVSAFLKISLSFLPFPQGNSTQENSSLPPVQA